MSSQKAVPLGPRLDFAGNAGQEILRLGNIRLNVKPGEAAASRHNNQRCLPAEIKWVQFRELRFGEALMLGREMMDDLRQRARINRLSALAA